MWSFCGVTKRGGGSTVLAGSVLVLGIAHAGNGEMVSAASSPSSSSPVSTGGGLCIFASRETSLIIRAYSRLWRLGSESFDMRNCNEANM